MKNVFGVLIAAAMVIVVAAPVQAADMDFHAKVKKSMSLLKEKLNKLGAPRLEGTSEIAGKTIPSIY